MGISKNYKALEEQIKNTTEFIDKGAIKLVRVRKNSKVPLDKGYYEKKLTINQIKKHEGNFGLCVGFNHDKGHSFGLCRYRWIQIQDNDSETKKESKIRDIRIL